MKVTEMLFASRAAVLQSEAEEKLLDKKIELELLRQVNDEALMRQALDALTATMSTHGFQKYIDQARESAIAALRERLGETK